MCTGRREEITAVLFVEPQPNSKELPDHCRRCGLAKRGLCYEPEKPSVSPLHCRTLSKAATLPGLSAGEEEVELGVLISNNPSFQMRFTL